jgi:tRNA-specific 2-thiouridylase
MDGPLLDEEGHEVGRHSGYWRFTPGQRRGLGVAASRPLHVLRTHAASNAVVVGSRASLASTSVEVEGELYVPAERVHAKLRHRSDLVRARVEATGGGFTLELEEPAYAVAPGQIAALYDRDAVVGAGTITAVS